MFTSWDLNQKPRGEANSRNIIIGGGKLKSLESTTAVSSKRVFL